MRLNLIACDVLFRELCSLVSRSPHIYDLVFTEKNAHNKSEELKRIIQEHINQSEGKGFDAILLAYGLCGNASVGVKAQDTKIVIPRAHDCCTLFLGSKERFREHFQDHPSQPFSSAGYMERGENMFHDSLEQEELSRSDEYKHYVKEYGEENAGHIYATMHPPRPESESVVYIDMPDTAHLGYADVCRRKAEEQGLEFLLLEGSTELLRKLVNGEWNESDFLILQPGETSKGIYDWERIIDRYPEP